MTARYRGVLFDLDGTLVDSLDLILGSYRHTMRKHLGRVPPDAEWMRTMGKPLRVQLESFADSRQQLDAMFETYIEHNQAHHDRLIRLFPRMREVLSTLHRAGYRLGVVTSKIRDNALRELRTGGLEGLFDALVSANDVERPKPDPEPVERALRGLDLPAADVLLVGDSLYDLQAGRAAGVHTAAALWGPSDHDHLAAGAPDYWLHDIDELLELLCVDPEAGRD